MSWLAVSLGLVLGLRHAFDPDHVAAVATLLRGGERRGSMRRGLALGAMWGLGHATTLALSVALLSALRLELHPSFPAALELAVAAMLVALGARSIWMSWHDANRGAPASHRHGDATHTHPMTLPHVHVAGTALAWRPLLIGGLHGLAGSGGMMLLLSSRQDTGWQVAGFTAAFVLGSILSMAAVSAAGAVALGAVTGRAQRGLTALAGAASVVIGILWALGPLAELT
jgi:high-affinity nickel-transport protein